MRISDWSSDVCSSDLAGNVPQAIAAFKRAVTEDPDFALACAKLSSERAVARYWVVDQSEANLQAMELEAKRAPELATRLSEAHAAMGFVQALPRISMSSRRADCRPITDRGRFPKL